MSKEKRPGARLSSALIFVRPGAVVADVGTDHAYLPIELIRRGIAVRAIAGDVNEGPLSRAVANIDKAGFSDRIETVLTDGLQGMEQYDPDHILIFGMGGELIVRILADAPWVRREGVRLILQPMSRAEELRRWLRTEGFDIVGEELSREDGRIYQTVCAEWSGVPTSADELDCLLGSYDRNGLSPLYEEFVDRNLRVQEAILRGRSGGKDADTAPTRALIAALRRRKEEIATSKQGFGRKV